MAGSCREPQDSESPFFGPLGSSELPPHTASFEDLNLHFQMVMCSHHTLFCEGNPVFRMGCLLPISPIAIGFYYLMHICMVAFSELTFDYRIFREAKSLRQAGHKITILSTSFRNQKLDGWHDIEIHLLPLDRTRSLRYLYPRFWQWSIKLLQTFTADAYHAHDLDSLLPCSFVSKKFNRPLVYDSHEFWTEQSSLHNRRFMRNIWGQLERRLIGQANHVITVSKSIATSLEERYPQSAPITVIRNLPIYRPYENSQRIREITKISTNRPIVLYQGGFLTDNGLYEQIVASKKFGNAAFVLIGDGPQEKNLKDLVQKHQLQETVYFIDRVPFTELHTYTCSADIALCLIKGSGKSFYYSLPNKLFEYFMAGLPVVASAFPEMQKIINTTQAGITGDPNSIDDIANKVSLILECPEKRKRYRSSALDAAKSFNWEKESKALIKLYSGI